MPKSLIYECKTFSFFCISFHLFVFFFAVVYVFHYTIVTFSFACLFFLFHLKCRFIYGCPLSTSFHHFSAVDICSSLCAHTHTHSMLAHNTRQSSVYSRIAFLSSSYLKLQIRFVYFVTQQFSRRKKNSWCRRHRHWSRILSLYEGATKWRMKRKKTSRM